jgi:hypothetical protein
MRAATRDNNALGGGTAISSQFFRRSVPDRSGLAQGAVAALPNPD